MVAGTVRWKGRERLGKAGGNLPHHHPGIIWPSRPVQSSCWLCPPVPLPPSPPHLGFGVRLVIQPASPNPLLANS